MQSITIEKRYCGPPNSANGGYACGLVAKPLGEAVKSRCVHRHRLADHSTRFELLTVPWNCDMGKR
jgi:hypothetical protein